MTEKAKKSTNINKADPKYLARRSKNREAVIRCRQKKALEEERRQKACRKLERDNNYLEGQIHGLRSSKKMFIELLMEQSRRLNRQLTQEQINLINAQDSPSEESSESSSSESSSDEDEEQHSSQHNSVNEPPQQYSQSTIYNHR